VTFRAPVASVSFRVAPAVQGTAAYVSTAFSANGKRLAGTAVRVTQDSGDPADTGPGYFTIGLANLPAGATRVQLTNEFVRSSFSHITQIDYGVASISYVSQ
jgi:hypothetical protein